MQQLIYTVSVTFFLGLALGPLISGITHNFSGGARRLGTVAGSLLLLICLLLASVLFAAGGGDYLPAALLLTVGFALPGAINDVYSAVKKREGPALKGWAKWGMQGAVALAASLYAYFQPDLGSSIFLPYFDFEWDMGVMFIPAMTLALLGVMGCVENAPKKKGVAPGAMAALAGTYAVVFFLLGDASAQDEALGVNLRNMMVFSGAAAGSCFALCWFSKGKTVLPLGETGMMLLGGCLCAMALFSRGLLLLVVAGVLLVAGGIVALQQNLRKLLKKQPRARTRTFETALQKNSFFGGRADTAYLLVTLIMCLLTLLAYLE